MTDCAKAVGTPFSKDDLNHILAHTGNVWEPLLGASLFITGGSGFVGIWLLESLLHANQALHLNLRIVALMRDPGRFAYRHSHLAANPALVLHRGAMEDFEFPEGDFTHVIHAATTPYPLASGVNRRKVFERDVDGTRHVLDFASKKRIRRLLFTSSGAVYGRQPPDLSHIPEEYPGAPSTLDTGSGYGQAKRASEFLCVTSGAEHGYDVVVARLFAFVGPHLPQESIFAVGNFVRDALRGGPVVVQGDGTPFRSYLYAADMAIWLWTMLMKGQAGEAYNVGSDEAITIRDLAARVAEIHGMACPVEVLTPARPGEPASRYVPDVSKATRDLGLQPLIELDDAIARYLAWCQNARAPRLNGEVVQ